MRHVVFVMIVVALVAVGVLTVWADSRVRPRRTGEKRNARPDLSPPRRAPRAVDGRDQMPCEQHVADGSG